MSEYKRLTTNEPEDNVETMLNYLHNPLSSGRKDSRSDRFSRRI